MRLLDGPVFRLLIFPMLFVCSSLWFLVAFRLLALRVFLTTIILYFLNPQRCKTAWAGLAWMVFLGSHSYR